MRTTTDSKAKQKQTKSGTMDRKEFSNGAVIKIGYLTERQHKAADAAKSSVDRIYKKALEECYREMGERG